MEQSSLSPLRALPTARSSVWRIYSKRLSSLTKLVCMFSVSANSIGASSWIQRQWLSWAQRLLAPRNIRLTSAVTVLSAADPVRIFQEFATLDLISHGRAEIVAGRGSSIEVSPLFGFDLDDYESLFSEKLDLLLKIREDTHISWTGKHRAPLTGQAVYPRPLQNPLPVWIGVGGTPESFVRAVVFGGVAAALDVA